MNITSETHLKELPSAHLKFVADVHLGKLTKYLRLFGFDTYYSTDYNDNEIIELALSDKRVILTRDKELLKNKKVTHGYRIRSQDPVEQLNEIIIHFDLKNHITPFSRCMECNGLLNHVSKKEILDRILPKTRQFYRKFKKCNDCNRIYWNGSHYISMKRQFKILMSKT
jgi:uncharacterized protein with PIN domain